MVGFVNKKFIGRKTSSRDALVFRQPRRVVSDKHRTLFRRLGSLNKQNIFKQMQNKSFWNLFINRDITKKN